MVAIFQNKHQKFSESYLKKSISVPFERESTFYCDDSVNNNQSIILNRIKSVTNIRFYTLVRDFLPLDVLHLSNNKIPFLYAPKGTLVQVLSIYEDNDNFVNVRLVTQIGQGLIPKTYLREDMKVANMLPQQSLHANSVKPETVQYQSFNTTYTSTSSVLSPPTSPSTLCSKSFSMASKCRSNLELTSQRSSLESLFSMNEVNIKSIEYNKGSKRLQYKLTVHFSDETVNKKQVEKYYTEFYQLHTEIIRLKIIDKAQLPKLPPPVLLKSKSTQEVNITLERLQEFNNYFHSLVSIIHGPSSSIILKNLLYSWLMHDVLELPNITRYKIKIYYNGDFYISKVINTNMDSLTKLKSIIKNKLKLDTDTSVDQDILISAKIDGWYIVELSNEEVYQDVLSKTWLQKRLVLDVVHK